MQTQTVSIILLPLIMTLLFPASLVSAFTSGSACPPTNLSVRLPPYLDPALNSSNTSSMSNPPVSSFVAPPTSFFAGTWYLTNSSEEAYRTYGNLQWDLWPVLPTCEQNTTTACLPGTVAGVLDEVTTWVPTDNKTALFGAIGGGGRAVASIRAYDTPRRLNFPDLNSDWDAVFDNLIAEGGPAGWTQTWSVVYWGSDTYGLPFMIAHENPGTYASGEQGNQVIDVISMNVAGPDEESLTDVLNALMELGNSDVTAAIENVAPVKWNYDLIGGPAICGIGCMVNKAE